MENESENMEIATLKSQLEALKDQIKSAHDMLKWGLGLAFLIFGFNWWTASKNSDRDRDALKQQTALLQQELGLAQRNLEAQNEKQIAAIRIQVETNIAGLASLQDKTFADINRRVETNILALIAARKEEMDKAIAVLNNASSNANAQMEARLVENAKHIADVAISLAQSNAVLASNLVSAFEIETRNATAISLAVQGNQCCLGNKATTREEIITLGAGISSYLQATEDWLIVKDEGNVRRTLDKLQKYEPILAIKSPPIHTLLSTIEDLANIGAQSDHLMHELENPRYNNRYSQDVQWLQIQNRLYKKLVQEDRERRLTRPEKTKT
jgi:hypothetical protein